MKKFSEWAKEADGKLFNAREAIKNALATMHDNPRILPQALQHALQNVIGNEVAESLIRRMQDLTVTFFQNLQSKNIKPTDPNYSYAYKDLQSKLSPLFDRLNMLGQA